MYDLPILKVLKIWANCTLWFLGTVDEHKCPSRAHNSSQSEKKRTKE